MKAESEGSVEERGKEMGSTQQEARICPVCGTKFFATTDNGFSPVCILRGATPGESAVTREPGSVSVISERYLGDESAQLRFLREARAAASVRHPNVASVFHLGKTGSSYFYAMEFVEERLLSISSDAPGRLK